MSAREALSRARRWAGSTNARLQTARFRWHCERLPERVERPVFVKVGANDGVTGDPCSDLLLRDARWRGVLIEPVPYAADRLKQNFADARFTVVETAIGREDTSALFYFVRAEAKDALPTLPEWFDQIGSFDREHIVRQLPSAEPWIASRAVPVATLGRVLDDNDVDHVDLLHIDTEGHDLEVLRSFDLKRWRPSLVFVEHKHLSAIDRAALKDLLRSAGLVVNRCGGDFFALDVTQ